MTAPEGGLDGRRLPRAQQAFWARMAECESASAPPSHPHVLFALQGLQFGVAAALAKAVLRRPPLAPLPGLPQHVPGVVGFRGSALSVTDTVALLGGPPGRRPEPGYLLVVAAGGVRTGLWVERVVDVVAIPDAEVTAPQAPWAGAPSGAWVGRWNTGTASVALLDATVCIRASAVGGDSPRSG